MTSEQYIEHEVRLRVMKEVNNDKFIGIEKEFSRLNSKLNNIWLTMITGIILPVVLHYFKMI